MPRALLLCLTIVAAFSARATAAGPVSEDLPVPADVIEAAGLVGIDPARGRARFLAELVRVIYTPPPGKSPAVQLLTRPPRRQAEAAPTFQASQAAQASRVPPVPPLVPVPLSAEVWSRAIFRRTVPPDQLVRAIVADRRAALVAHALAALDDETLGYLSEHPSILVRLYESDAPFFAGFGGTLRIREGRVVPPGGPQAVSLWESVLEAPVSSPERFLRALYGEFQGRLAYLYDTLAQLPEPNRRFALGLWVPDDAMRLLRFGELARIVAGSYGEWQLDLLPFSKPLHDIAMSLLRIRVDASGAPAPPSSRAFWSEVFGSSSLDAAELASLAADAADDPLDAAWLAATLGSNDLYWRGDRLDQFAFGQRVFAGAERSAWPDAVVALRALPRARMLLLTLERMRFTSPSLYALTARRAVRIPTGNPDEAFWTLAQLQASHVLVARMLATGTIDPAAGEKLVSTLYEVPLEGGRYLGGIAGWFQGELLPALPDADTLEGRLIGGLAGPAPGPSAARLAWEGHDYRVDLAFAEAARLRAVREKQAGYSADVAIELYRIAQLLAVRPLTVLAINEASARLNALRETAGARATPAPEVRSPGLAPTRSAMEVVERAVVDLARSLRGNELRRAERVAPQLLETVDHVLAEALLSFAYAVDLGDPDGTPLLARNVAVRHDFGFSRRDTNIRARSAWAVPRQDFLPGVPWHIAGSVLGLDIALGSLALRRLGLNTTADAPRLPSNEREAFAVSLSLMNPWNLRDADRTAITSAIGRGRQRVAGLAAGREPLESVADALELDGWRRRALQWTTANDAAAVPNMFSMAELLELGGGAANADLDAWGTSALYSLGCACTRVESPRRWRLLSGRPQLGLMASAVPDLNLHVAVLLDQLAVPAALARTVLAAAVQTFIEEAEPTDANDWWALVRSAGTVGRERIEDYVATAAIVDGPLVPNEAAVPVQP